MVEQDQAGKRTDETVRQARRVPITEPSRPEAGRPAAASEARAGARQEVSPTAAVDEAGGNMEEGMSRMIGSAQRTAGETVSGVSNTAATALHSVGAVGGDAIGVTRDVLKSAIAATEDVGTDLVGGVRHLAKDVVDGVGDVGGSAVHTLTDLMVGLVGGMKTVVGEVLPRGAGRVQPREEIQPRTERTETMEEMIP